MSVRTVLAALLAAIALATPARAEFLALTPPGGEPLAGGFSGSIYSDGVIVDVNSTFELTSLGFRFDPISPAQYTMQANLYAVEPGTLTRGGLLVSGPPLTIFDPNPGQPIALEWYNLPIEATLEPGRYELEIRSAQTGFLVSVSEFFPFTGPPFDVGPITVLAGTTGGGSSFDLTHFQLNGVPEPSALVLAIVGTGAFACRSFRRRLSLG